MKPKSTTVNLEGLIRTIQEEGVEAAKQESERILTKARDKAGEIVKSAEERAEQLMKEARQRIEREEESARHAMEQAARDVVLSAKAALVALVEGLMRRECGERMSGEALERLILEVARGWMKQESDGGAVDLQVNESDRERLAATFVSRLQETLQAGVELKVRPEIQAGFRIGRPEGSMFYDFTDQEVAAALAELVNTRLAKLFDEKAFGAGNGNDG